jgi:hypothetical protein
MNRKAIVFDDEEIVEILGIYGILSLVFLMFIVSSLRKILPSKFIFAII